MKRLLAAAVLLLAPASAAAAEDHVAYIDSVIKEAMAELDATALDEVTPPSCALYADRLYVALHLLEEMQRRPHSGAIGSLFGSMLTPLISSREACRSAV